MEQEFLARPVLVHGVNVRWGGEEAANREKKEEDEMQFYTAEYKLEIDVLLINGSC